MNMNMNIDIKHKHSGHVIIIEGHAFKANDRGQWDLTDIWRTLKLPKSKQPGKWVDTKRAGLQRQVRLEGPEGSPQEHSEGSTCCCSEGQPDTTESR